MLIIHDFSVWLRTGSDSTDINRFRSHTGKKDFFHYSQNNTSFNFDLTIFVGLILCAVDQIILPINGLSATKIYIFF